MESEEESDYSVENDFCEEEDWSDDDDHVNNGRSLLWLCQEGQLDSALQRVLSWERQATKDGVTNDSIRRELFQTNADGNYALHEILMGGTTDSAAFELTRLVVTKCLTDYANDARSTIFAATPPSHRRTALHWAAWGNASKDLLQLIAKANPEALCLRDDKRKGFRTPLEISQRYWAKSEGTELLHRWTASYLPYRVQFTVHLCAHRHFLIHQLTPFLSIDRRKAGLAPRAWFALSVIGYVLQREMTGLVLHILSFIGKGAKIDGKKRKRGKSKSKRTQIRIGEE